MPSPTAVPPHQEIELKLALPCADPAALPGLLAKHPALVRRKSERLALHNVYYDTPDQQLRKAQAVLRIRRAEDPARSQWLQTLKVGGDMLAALSRRGEWETEVATAALDIQALPADVWSRLDPDGRLFEALAPCFVTAFERTRWQVRRRDGSCVEVALDIGEVRSAGQTAPICELELELLAGPPQALFDLALSLASTLALLPLTTSKSQRGFALAEGSAAAPVAARPAVLMPRMALADAARTVLREMFAQFSCNLVLLRDHADPELVHQARVGWRRFRTARRLFRKVPGIDTLPGQAPLEPLLQALGVLRDIEVARDEVLPPWASAYVDGDGLRESAWLHMRACLDERHTHQRATVSQLLEQPATGAVLLAMTVWLEGVAQDRDGAAVLLAPARVIDRAWAVARLKRMRERLDSSAAESRSAQDLHHTRILAKRIRYAVESLRGLLPRKQAARWHRQATRLQKGIGNTRDGAQAVRLLTALNVHPGLIEFIRGACADGSSAAPS